MSLFVVQHKHSDATCPAKSKEMGGMLLSHLSPKNAESYGLKIKGEGVINGKHTLYLILEAANEQQVKKFMEPFAMAGSVEVMPASPCEVVVERGAC
jgi:hypothetical protein